ncbi:unnamed protein product [Symbiodinium microadriaticum]|nr:unnamed protein product [Symbiodinium microadriaticum]
MRLHRLLFILLPVSVIGSGAEQLESLVGAGNPLANACTRFGGPVMWGPVKQGGELCVQGPVNVVATSPVGSIVHISVCCFGFRSWDLTDRYADGWMDG